jgi:hypothetical protein
MRAEKSSVDSVDRRISFLRYIERVHLEQCGKGLTSMRRDALNDRCIQNGAGHEAILAAARSVVDGACRIVECSKVLVINSKEASLWQQLATHTKSVSESIKRLATSVK